MPSGKLWIISFRTSGSFEDDASYNPTQKIACILPSKSVILTRFNDKMLTQLEKGVQVELVEMIENEVVGREGIEPSTY
jgi:hypothetical protein